MENTSISAVRRYFDPTVKSLWLLWAVFLVSIIVLYAITQVISPKGVAHSAVVGPESIVQVFVFIAMMAATISLALPKLVFSKLRIEKLLNQRIDLKILATNQQTVELNKQLLQRLEEIPERYRGILPLRQTLMVCFIVRYALNESIALLGLLLSILEISTTEVMPFFMGAFFVHLFSMPKIERLFDMLPADIRAS